ncbi:MAG: hypothetical protein K6E97_09090 [Treponema sp.]|nr:hypothetical protein [Treponema sp.]
MKRVLKCSVFMLVMMAFGINVFARPADYSYSGFGGGLPSSVVQLDEELTDEELQTELLRKEQIAKREKAKKTTKIVLITVGVVGGVVLVAACVAGCVALANGSEECCSEASNNMCSGCGDEMSKSCADSTSDACSSSASEGCSSNIFGSLIPVYVP